MAFKAMQLTSQGVPIVLSKQAQVRDYVQQKNLITFQVVEDTSFFDNK